MLSEYLNSKIQEAYGYMQNDSEMALKIFDEILEIEPEHIEAINGKGSTLIKLNRLDDAEIFFNQSLLIRENSSALINKGIISKINQNYDDALTYFDRTVENNPDLTDIVKILKGEIHNLINDDLHLNDYSMQANEYIKKADEYRKENKLWDALHSYELAIREDSSCRDSVEMSIDEIKNILHGEFLFEDANFDSGEKIGRLKNQSLKFLFIEKNPEKALALMNVILDIDENDLNILNHKGSILFLFDKNSEAIGCFDRCLGADDKYYYAMFNKGLVLRRIDNLKESLECFDEVLKTTHDSEAGKYKSEILDKLDEAKNSD